MALRPFTVLLPTAISDTNLVSSTLPENDYPSWVSGTNYSIGNRVIYQHYVYQAIQAVTSPNNTLAPNTIPAFWDLVGPTNRWGMFDESGNTFSSSTSSFEFVLTGNRINTIALLDVAGTSVRVRAFNSTEGTYYDKTITLSDNALVTNWYEYFYTDISRKTEAFFFDIPAINNSTYTITVNGTSYVAVGTFAMGSKSEFGFSQYGAKVGIRNFGNTQVDEYGRVTFVRRRYAKTMDVTVWLENTTTDAIFNELANLRDVAAVFIATPDIYEMLTVYGRLVDFNIDVQYVNKTVASISIEGLS